MPDIDLVFVGGGIAGLVGSIAARRNGLTAAIIERETDWTPRGAGMHLYSNAIRALDSIGIGDAIVEAGSAHADYLYSDSTNAHEVRVEYPRLAGDDRPGLCLVQRTKLHQVLVDAARTSGVDIRLGTEVVGWAEGSDCVDVELSDGSTMTASLLVGADGVRSQIRRAVFGDVPVSHTGQGIWRALLPRHPESVDPKIMFSGGGKMFGVVPVDDDTVYLMMGEPAEQGARYAEEDFVEIVRDVFAHFGGLAPWYLERIVEPGDVIFTAIEEVNLDPPWHVGRVLLIGDAAHASAPYLAQGAAMAIEDGVVLADEMSRGGDIESVIARFTERRFPRAGLIRSTSIERNRQRYQGGSYEPGPDGAMSGRMQALSDNAQRQIDELYARLAEPV